MPHALRLHLAAPPRDTGERPSAEDIARAKAISECERAEAYAQIEAHSHVEEVQGDGILLIVDAYDAMGFDSVADLLSVIERYGIDRVRRWLVNVSAVGPR